MNTHNHNPEIMKVLEGCGKHEDNEVGTFVCGDTYGKEQGKYSGFYLCKSCKSKIQGIIIAQENEIKFLEEFTGGKFGFAEYSEDKLWNKMNKELTERIQTLKQSNEDLREVVK